MMGNVHRVCVNVDNDVLGGVFSKHIATSRERFVTEL